MNFAHLHLMLNHFPIIGTVVGFALVLVSRRTKRDELNQAGLAALFIMALLTLPIFVTGAFAEGAVNNPEASTLLEKHKDAALLAFVFMEITGILAWLGLWQSRRFSRPARWNVSSVLFLSVVTLVLMMRTGTIGTGIRHPEVRSHEETTASEGADSWTHSVASVMHEKLWAWPASESLHFVGMPILFGVVLMVSLRTLGIAKSLPFAALHRLLPLGVFGFGINVVSGMLFLIADPGLYLARPAFPPKIALIVLAGTSILYFTVFDEVWDLKPGDDASLAAKVVAAATIALWLGVIFFGRMLPYLGNKQPC